MPSVKAPSHHRAMPTVSSSQRSRSHPSACQSASFSSTTPSTAPSSVSLYPPRHGKRATNTTVRLRKGITVNDSTGDQYYSDEEDSSGVQVSVLNSEEEYTEDDESEEEEEDEEEDDESGDDEWEQVGEYGDEIQPSDSASRPRNKHHSVPPPALAVPRSASHRASSRHAVPVSDPPSRHRSRSRSKHMPRRQRPRSVHQDALEDPDDYHYPPAARGGAGGHPSNGWGHVPQGAPNGYAPSMMGDPRYGGQPPSAGQLVPFSAQDPYYAQNPFSPNGQNPFTQPPPHGREPNPYFPEYPEHRPSHGRRPSHRSSMPPPPPGELMPYSPMGYGYPPPFASPYGLPPHMYPYGHPPHPPHPSPPPQHSSKRGTPKPREEEPAPPPPPQMPTMQMPITPVPDPKEEVMLSKLEKLLLGKQTEDEKAAEAAKQAAENLKFSRLEDLLIKQEEQRMAKEKAKKLAAEEAIREAQEKKKRGDEDKLAKLEKLILAQKEEQLKRETATEALRLAEKKDAEEKAAKVAADKKAAAEAAKNLLEAAKKARDEAEKKAAEEAEKTKKEYEKALAEAKAAHEALEKEKEKAKEEQKKAEEEQKKAEEEAKKLKPPEKEPAKAPIKFKDAVGRKFSFPWHLCKSWNGMEELIKQAFLHIDVIGPHVQQGHYDLIGPDGEIILPQIWETMVQPDWTIIMQMWPMPEPPKEPPRDLHPPPPPPPPPDAAMFLNSVYPPLTKANKAKKDKAGKKRESVQVHPHTIQVPHGIPPPPGMPFMPMGEAVHPLPPPLPQPSVVVVSTPSSTVGSTRRKTQQTGFFRWAAGPSPAARRESVKKAKK